MNHPNDIESNIQLAIEFENEQINMLLSLDIRYFEIRRVDMVLWKSYLRNDEYTIDQYKQDKKYGNHMLDEFCYVRTFKDGVKEETRIRCDGGVGVFVNIERWKESFYKELERRELFLHEKTLVTNIIQEIDENYVKKEDLFLCPKCSSNCEKKYRFCPYCQFTFPICEICKRNITNDEKQSNCPKCEAVFHEPHLAEVIKLFKKCPICREEIKEEDLIRTPIEV